MIENRTDVMDDMLNHAERLEDHRVPTDEGRYGPMDMRRQVELAHGLAALLRGVAWLVRKAT